MDTHHFVQRFAQAAQAQGLDAAAGKSGNRARLVVDVVLDQGDFSRLGVVTNQLDLNV